MSKRLLGIGDVYTYDYKQVHKTRNVGFGFYDPNKVSTTSSTDGYVLVDGVLSVVNEDGSSEPGPTPPTPSLPPFTLRLKFKDGVTPEFSYGTATQVSSSPNVWDWSYEDTNWNGLLAGQTNLLKVIDGNTTDITNMSHLFYQCYLVSSVSLFDTSNVTNMQSMFEACNNLTTIPLFDTSSVTDMSCMFVMCQNVQSGALALYQQASSQTSIPTHNFTFYECGRNTQTGSAELAQIPGDWK